MAGADPARMRKLKVQMWQVRAPIPVQMWQV
jgi:hypothetical protein